MTQLNLYKKALYKDILIYDAINKENTISYRLLDNIRDVVNCRSEILLMGKLSKIYCIEEHLTEFAKEFKDVVFAPLDVDSLSFKHIRSFKHWKYFLLAVNKDDSDALLGVY